MLPVQGTDWRYGEPNNGNGYHSEDCVEMDPPTGNWNDVICNLQLNFICEISTNS
ncbi:hypothetical protein FSP39_017644 [Pinctada imbricata]|uniref:C-type lectin domain-containing protein n=1 Tax=Pinctada imbricata TaxID=66713 RepID=A0AA89BKX0_PINIB|nr:hypothetical protein FSP39_017644 [Pinctada imbricata]